MELSDKTVGNAPIVIPESISSKLWNVLDILKTNKKGLMSKMNALIAYRAAKRMATGGVPFEDSAEELHNWSITNVSLEDRLNNMDWGVQQKKANRSADKNKKKPPAGVVESRLTNDISPDSTPGAGRRRIHTPHSLPHIKYTTQMSVPDQAELDKLRQRINFTDLDERSVGSDSQGRVTAANNQRQLGSDVKKPFLPLHVNTNKSKELQPPSFSAPATPALTKETKKQSPVLRDSAAPVVLRKDISRRTGGTERGITGPREHRRGESSLDNSQVVSKLVQIREYISKARSMWADLVEKNDVPANVERLSQLIEHLKEQEQSYLRLLQKMLAQHNEQDDAGTMDSAVGSGSLAESNVENPSSDAYNATVGPLDADQKEELENLRKQHELLKKMLEQQEQLRVLQGRQEALMAMQHNGGQALAAVDDTIVTETTGSVSGLSITSELNDELNDLIQRFHNQLHDSQTKTVPDNRRQAESLSLSREVGWSRPPQAPGPPQHRPLLHSASGPHTGLDTGATAAKLTKLQELQDKKQTMDRILQELQSLRDQTLNNNYCRGVSAQRSLSFGGSSDYPPALGAAASTSFHLSHKQHQDHTKSTDKLRKLKEVHKRLNELRELVQYYEQTSDMMVDAVNENVKEEGDDEDEEDETEDGSLFEAIFDSEQETHQPVTNIRNKPQTGNWADRNSLTIGASAQGSTSNNHDSRLNRDCEINNRSANIRSLNVAIDCQHNRDAPYKQPKGDEDRNNDGARPVTLDNESSRRSSLDDADEYPPKMHRQTAKQKLRQLQELVAMVQSDDTDVTTANEDDSLQQQPNNTRAPVAEPQSTRSKQNPRTVSLSSKAREQLYEEKLRQQKQELKQLHEERRRLIEIQDKISDLQWACPDLQSSLSSTGQQGLLRKVPAASSTPAKPLSSPGPKFNSVGLKPTPPEAATPAVTDNEQLWSEMRRHQIMREELRQRRKHLECLMAEHQRRNGFSDSFRLDDNDSSATPSQPASRDERTMATWGSTPCNLNAGDEDDGEVEGENSAPGIDEEQEDAAESTSDDDDVQIYSSGREQRCYTNGNNRECNLQPMPTFSCDSSVQPSPQGKADGKPFSRGLNQTANQPGPRRQENLRWASDLSSVEGSWHWQEQISQLQGQLDFSTSMCQTLLQDQQNLSYMLQTLLTGQYSMLPNNLSSPQVHLVMHQLNQCYTQLAWQQNNVQRLKQVLNELLLQQQQQQQQQRIPPSAGLAAHNQSSSKNPATCPSAASGVFPPFSSCLHSPANNMASAALPAHAPSFSLFPLFRGTMGTAPAGATEQRSPDNPKQHLDANNSMKTEYMSFPPPLQRSPFNSTTETESAGWLDALHKNNTVVGQTSKTANESPATGPRRNRLQDLDQASQESFSSLVDPFDTAIMTYKTGRKASAQANLATRSKTPKTKSRRRWSKGRNNNTDGQESDGVSSITDICQKRAAPTHPRDKNQHLLDKLTQEKLDSKSSAGNKRNDLSSAYAWRTPFLCNRIACTEAPDASSDFSLFEALRETIYSEVATLISQNESRPHFLIELFHELQLLNTDYLRQRALYSLQDIVTRHLSENGSSKDQIHPLGPEKWTTDVQSELTPSQSLETSDDEVVEKNLRLPQDLKRKDDTESVGNDSMSTSSNLDPFAKDDLGNTVIHLDKALHRIKEYERMKLKAVFDTIHVDGAGASESDGSNAECGAASAADPLEAERAGDVPHPQIDTQLLDRQIKSIMKEVIPFLNEHKDEVCSPQLLTSVRRMVLTLAQQNDESKDLVNFFHRPLGGILQESLNKFVGRTLNDCGEDLLVEISEILFNELAFFRLMQHLDSSSSKVSSAAKQKTKDADPGKLSGALKVGFSLHTLATWVLVWFKNLPPTQENNVAAGDRSYSLTYLDEDKDQDEAEQEAEPMAQASYMLTKMNNQRSSESSEAEEELGGGQELPLSINLSKAESQALTSYGSGEDENEEEEMEEFEAEPAEVQTSVQASAEEVVSSEAMEEKSEGSEESEDDANMSFGPGNSTVVEQTSDQQSEAAAAVHTAAVLESNTSSSTDSPVMINADEVGSANTSQKSDEDDFVKVDDLPLQLTVMCQEELQKRIVEEQQNNNLSVEILNGNTDTLNGLVGTTDAVKDPENLDVPSV
ncbi:pericentriolar material 1 protein isoform 3-T3 [Synchiropus picturatus]